MLSSRGLCLIKDANLITLCERELVVQPETNKEFPELPAFAVYQETASHVHVPVGWARNHGYHVTESTLDDRPTTLEFTGELRPHQEEAAATTHQHLLDQGRGILCLQTGGGKTFTSLYVASLLGQRVLVVVNKRSLLDQWHKEIMRFLPSARVGYLWQKKCDLDDDHDIVLASWQTLLRRREVPQWHGTLIIDECHRVCSKEFSQIMFMVNTKYVLGLSATPERKDGLTRVLHWHLGDIAVKQQPTDRSEVPVQVRIVRYPTPDLERQYGSNISRNYVKIIGGIIKDPQRTRRILQEVIRLKTDPEHGQERRVLILTERIKHAELLHAALTKIFANLNTPVGLFIGTQKLEQLNAARHAHVLVGTYSLMAEGISIDAMNALILATPKKDITQSLGRVFRKRHAIPVVVVDMVDSILQGMGRRRLDTIRRETNGSIRIEHL